MPIPRELTCPRCDTFQHLPVLKEGQVARCSTCDIKLFARRNYRISRSLAFCIAGIFAWIISLTLPFLSVDKIGLHHDIYLLETVTTLLTTKYIVLALVVAFVIVLAPVIWLGITAWICAYYLRHSRLPRRFAPWLRFSAQLQPWAMSEIYFIAVLVAVVKLTEIVHITTGPAFWSLVLQAICIGFATFFLCRHTLWNHVEA